MTNSNLIAIFQQSKSFGSLINLLTVRHHSWLYVLDFSSQIPCFYWSCFFIGRFFECQSCVHCSSIFIVEFCTSHKLDIHNVFHYQNNYSVYTCIHTLIFIDIWVWKCLGVFKQVQMCGLQLVVLQKRFSCFIFYHDLCTHGLLITVFQDHNTQFCIQVYIPCTPIA